MKQARKETPEESIRRIEDTLKSQTLRKKDLLKIRAVREYRGIENDIRWLETMLESLKREKAINIPITWHKA